MPTAFRAAAVVALLFTSMCTTARGQATERQYLSGTDRDTTVRWDFMCTAGRKSGQWTTIPVPSCWDVQGFGHLAYSRDDAKQPIEQGLYRHAFSVPSSWEGKRVFLVFDGSMTDTEVKVNGQSAGPVHQGAFYRFKYDVTPLLRIGADDNLLEVTVSRHSANESVNRAERQADYWVFGGIFRPVYLEAVPQNYIDRVAIDARADGSFAIDVYAPEAKASDAVSVDVLDGKGAVVATASGAASGDHARLTTRADGIATWTAETPSLYTARVRLKSRDQIVHEIAQRFGFRTIKVRKGDGVYVNGQRVMMKGVCRHASWPDSGKTLSPAIDRNDIGLIKDMNMNAVRMSHYPPDESFLDLCDEVGLYVLDELGGWQKSYDAEVGAKLVGEMVRRDVNHPSIVFWDNGNEGGWNTALDGEFGKWDPQSRRVLHPWALHDDVNTKHYPKYDLLTQLLNGPDVVMPTEYLHGLYDGGIGAGLRDYWDAMSRSRVSAGAFFWVFADEGVVRGDENGRMDVAGNAAPDGIVGPYRQKEGSFFTVKKIWSPVQLPDVLPEGFDGRLEVRNGYDFVPLERVKFHWQLRRWPGPSEAEGKPTVVAEGDAIAPNVTPHGAGTLALNLPTGWNGSDALVLTATDWTGREIWTWVWPLKDVRRAPSRAGEAPARQSDGGQTLQSGDVTLSVDAESGVIRSVRKGDKAIPLAAGPRLAFSPPRPLAVPATTKSAVAEPPTTAPAVATTARLMSAKWAPGNEGWFRLEYAYEAAGPCEFLGITFDLPEPSVRGARWLGAGPYRVWKNRLEGPTLGVWENAYNNTVTGWSGWVYPEFKGYFADLHWAKITTTDGAITVAAETPGLYLRLLTPELPPGNLARGAAAPFPDGGLSLLHAIPAIGSKFDDARRAGPQSQAYVASGTYRAVVWFRFE